MKKHGLLLNVEFVLESAFDKFHFPVQTKRNFDFIDIDHPLLKNISLQEALIYLKNKKQKLLFHPAH